MARTKQIAVQRDINGVRIDAGTTPPPLPASKLPPVIRFPLLAIVSLSMSALLYTFMADLTGYELASTSRQISPEWQTFAVVGTTFWRIAELAVGWFGGLDDLDLAALTITTHFPYLYLLHTFYLVSPTTAVFSLLIDTLSTSLPTMLLRSRSPTHSSSPAAAARVPNRALIQDLPVIASTSLLGAALYTVTIFFTLRAGINSFLIAHFDEIPSLAARDSANVLNLLLLFVPVGWAVREFILDPSLGAEAQPTSIEAKNEAFNPATASLKDTVKHNLGADEKRTRVVISRTALLAAMVLANTTIQVFSRVKGAELTGAIGWGAVFAVPAVLAGGAYSIVGDV